MTLAFLFVHRLMYLRADLEMHFAGTLSIARDNGFLHFTIGTFHQELI